MSTTTGPRLLLAGVVALALQATPVLVGFAAGDDVASESVTCPTVATAPINSTPIAHPGAILGGSATQDRGIGNECANLQVVGAPGTGRVIGGFGLTEPNQRAAFAYIAASVEIPRRPILDRDGNTVNREFFCEQPFIDLSDTDVVVTIWCRGPRDLPDDIVGLFTLDAVVEVPVPGGRTGSSSATARSNCRSPAVAPSRAASRARSARSRRSAPRCPRRPRHPDPPTRPPQDHPPFTRADHAVRGPFVSEPASEAVATRDAGPTAAACSAA